MKTDICNPVKCCNCDKTQSRFSVRNVRKVLMYCSNCGHDYYFYNPDIFNKGDICSCCGKNAKKGICKICDGITLTNTTDGDSQ